MSTSTLPTHNLRLRGDLRDADSSVTLLATLDAADTTTHETPRTPAAPPAPHERRHT